MSPESRGHELTDPSHGPTPHLPTDPSRTCRTPADGSRRGSRRAAPDTMTVATGVPLLRREELAEYLRIAPSTLDVWRLRGRVPAPASVERDALGRPRIVLWRRSDIDRWIAAGMPADGSRDQRGRARPAESRNHTSARTRSTTA